ncbi:MAG: type II toxin-antitoxin system RelE/ParE family toxin [Pirellulaceae bacterium]
MRYEVQLAAAVSRQLKKLPRDIQRRVKDTIDSLEDDPRQPTAKKLQGAENLWRVRVGDYRILYEIEAAKYVVLVIRIAHRKEVYRKGT